MPKEASETTEPPFGDTEMSIDGEQLAGWLSKAEGLATVLGEDWLAAKIQRFFALLTVRVFTERGPADLKGAILKDYSLVREVTPPAVKSTLPNVAPKFEDAIREQLSPDQVMEWLEDPDWSDELSDEEAERLQECADIIQEVPGGTKWLVDQIDDLHEMCGFSPED